MMKITDVLDIGRGVELEDKSVVQVFELYWSGSLCTREK